MRSPSPEPAAPNRRKHSASVPNVHPSWLTVRERGSAIGIRALLVVCNLLGRSAARFIVYGIALYYSLFHREARRVSRQYLRRVGEPDSFRNAYRHILRFAHCALDRVFFLKGRNDLFDVASHGWAPVRAAWKQGRGVMMLTAHMGNFEATRLHADQRDVTLKVIMNTANTQLYNHFIDSFESKRGIKVIHTNGHALDVGLRMKECIEAGDVIGVMADRVAPMERSVEVEFLGAKARLPAGPYAIAGLLHCPVFLCIGLYRGGNRYDVYFEELAPKLDVPRENRQQAIEIYAQQFASRLEHYCREEPLSWFNFYDFWNYFDRTTKPVQK